MKKPPFPNPDWWERNYSDLMEFFGYDDKTHNTTIWYTSDGTCDCVTAVPNENSIEVMCKISEGLMKHFS